MPEPMQTKVDGLRAVDLQYRPIREIATGRSPFFQSRTQLNTPELGTLMPEVFRRPAEFSGQSRKLFPLELIAMLEAVQAFKDREMMFEWFTVYVSMRTLRDVALEPLVTSTCDQMDIMPGRVCLTLPQGALDETDGIAANAAERLRRRGFHVMVTDFGENGCSFLKLSDIPADYVMLSPRITRYIGKNDRGDSAVRSVVSVLDDMGCKVIADGIRNSKQAEALYEFGCNYCAGSLAGNYLPYESYLPETAAQEPQEKH